MSRIRFEWNIESQRIDRSDGEDPLAKRRRRRNALVLLLLIALLIAVFVVGALLVRQRLIDIEIQVAQLLQDTVKAEIAALRIGDINTFLSIQAGSDEWRDRQRLSFQQYSELKAKGQIELTGSILSVDIDEERARVLVQENINDLPYARLWFYRRVENSWFHIAPDFAFWGEDRLYHAEHVVVRYRAADDRFARQLGDSLAEWMQQACEIFACVDMPSLTVNIDTNTADAVSWADEAAMQLVIRSPYTDIARADTPFDSLLRLRVSRLLAERIINAQSDYLAITYPSDASFLRNAMIAWLSERFTRIDSGARLMRSLADNYGLEAIPNVLALLATDSDMSLLAEVLPVPIERANLDWHDFIEWRLHVEEELIAARAEGDWLSLYDTSVESARVAAYERYNRQAPENQYKVVDQVIWTYDDGSAELRASVTVAESEQAAAEIVIFNLVDNVWKRAS